MAAKVLPEARKTARSPTNRGEPMCIRRIALLAHSRRNQRPRDVYGDEKTEVEDKKGRQVERGKGEPPLWTPGTDFCLSIP